MTGCELGPKPALRGEHQQSGRGRMCPVCMASAAFMVGSVITTGGLTALVVKIVRSNRGVETPAENNPKENAS
jgi:hypothetical protein